MFFQISRPNHTKPWNADDLDRLKLLIGEGRSIPELAKLLGRSQEAVRTKANDLDLLPKRTRRKRVAADEVAVGL